MAHGIHRRGTGFGPGNAIEKWLNAYGEGDVNRLEELNQWRNGSYGWVQSAPKSGRYLEHIKLLSSKWPHLQLLADFMDVGTTPIRWKSDVPGGYPEDNKPREAERNERMERTRVTLLDYPEDGKAPRRTDCRTAKELRDCIAQLDDHGQTSSSVKLRLFVVEDLSREVIETLGARYDVDPAFFREHLVDYIWYNIKDWWRDPPSLDIVSRGQNWFQLRFSRVRYFHNKESYDTGAAQAIKFNVYRLLQGDFNHSRFWDTDKKDKNKEAKVGNLRSRATFWIKDPESDTRPPAGEKPSGGDGHDASHRRGEGDGKSKPHEPVVGILLLDPTIKEGHPLWQKYRNWNRVPSLHENVPSDAAPPRGTDSSFFNDFLYWASRPQSFDFGSRSRGGGGGTGQEAHHCGGDHGPSTSSSSSSSSSPSSPICIPTQALLHLVCAEWLTLVDYIKTRLNQIDWAIAFPDKFLAQDETIEKALGNLHYWRRVVPVYRAMLAETFLRVFRETKHPDRMHPGAHHGGGGGGGGGGAGVLVAGPLLGGEAPPDVRRLSMVGGAAGPAAAPRGALEDLLDRECINAYRQDYTLVLNHLEEYQARIDRLTEVVTAVISIQDSRRGYKDNKNLQWLTWLATFFIPLSFVATMLSMTTGPLDELHDAAVMWAEVSIPSGLLIMSVVLLMSIARCRRAIRGFFIEFPWVGKARPFQKGR